MAKLKNLATCKPTEFLKQTNKIRKAVAKWLADVDLMSIRENLPELEKAAEGADEAEVAAIQARNRKRIEERAKENMWEFLDNALDKYPDETLGILAHMCFVEPSHVDDYQMEDYLEALSELMSNRAVIGFFTSLASLGNLNI